MHPQTLAIHAGQEPDRETGAISASIHPSTTFERDPDGGFSRGYFYSRHSNPNRLTLENTVAQVERGAGAVALSTGMAAIMSVLQTLKPGDHVLAPDDMYFGVRNLHGKVMARWGLELSAVDMTDLDAVRAALRPNTRMLWLESPSNPQVKVVDVAALAAIAREAGCVSCADNTWATPVLQRPLELGCDLVLHSATKYFGGHSDAMGGIVVAREADDTLTRLQEIQQEGGAVLAPFDSWLIQRGIHTLHCRVRMQCENARAVVAALGDMAGVEAVHFPGLSTHPGHEIATRQMDDYGAMLAFEVAGGAEAAMAAAARLRLIRRATSLGGTHTLIEHRHSIEGKVTVAPPGLLRMSIGLEHPTDLIDDLRQALDPG